MKKLFLQSVFLVFFTYTFHAFEITGNTRIVIGKNVPESTQLAAEELACYVQKVCGKNLQIVKGKSNAASRIMVGTLANVPELPAHAAAQLAKAKSPDAFAIVCQSNVLYIVGKDRVGELYAVYAFLDEKLGVRWFRTASRWDSYEYIPENAVLKFADFTIVRDPAFRYRQLSHVSATGKTPVNGQTLAVRQGFQISPPWNYERAYTEKFYQARTSLLAIGDGGHTAFSKAVPQTLFAKHPEYFALRDGKRVKGNQICIANPNVQKLVLEHVLSIYKKYPASEVSYLFGMPDTTTGWCECKACRKLDGTEKFDYINISNRFHKVAAKLMAAIYRKYPDARLEAWAYHTYRNAPENVTYDSRAMIYYCTHGRCYGHELNDPTCERNVKRLTDMKAWSKITSHMRLYDYANCTPIMYGCLEAIQVKDIHFFRKMNWEGWKEEMLFADADFWPRAKKGVPDYRADRTNSNWQWYCVMGKMLWNPELDPEKILADVESKYYGKAYPAMKKYHDFRRELWNNSSHCLGYPTGDQRRVQLLSVPGAKEKLLALLDQADRLAGNDAVLQGRLKDDRDWLARYWIEPAEKKLHDQGKTYVIPVRAGRINIDGNPDESEWLRAWHTTDFRYISGRKKGKLPGKSGKTVLSILADNDNLYFRIIGNGSKYDQTDFFIIPPGVAQKYYHLQVTDSAAVCSVRPQPGKHVQKIPGVTSAVKHTARGRVVEVKLPLTKISRIERGALWKIHVARSISGRQILSLEGAAADNRSSYRAFNIADAILKNGTFEELNKKGRPAAWITSECTIVGNGASRALKLSPRGYAYQLLAGGILAQKPYPRHIRITFRASGKGTLQVGAHRYNDTQDGKAKHGYRRKNFPTASIYRAKLTSEQKFYTCEYTVNANEWMALRFSMPGTKGGFAVIDDGAITLLEQ